LCYTFLLVGNPSNTEFFSALPKFRFNPDGPGEMGKAVVIPKEKEKEKQELFKINQFNLMASDMIALNRSLPDVRMEG